MTDTLDQPQRPIHHKLLQTQSVEQLRAQIQNLTAILTQQQIQIADQQRETTRILLAGGKN